MSPNKNNLAIYYDDEVKLLNMSAKELKTIIKPKKQICGVNYSPEGDNLMIWDQKCARSRDSGFYMHQYNIPDQTDNILYEQGDLGTKNYLYPYAWRPDNKIILLEVKEHITVWVFDIATKTLTPTRYQEPTWFSRDGRYMGLSERPSRFTGRPKLYDRSTRTVNLGPSRPVQGRYEIVDPATGKSYGTYGDQDKYNSIMGYSPSENAILYESSDRYGRLGKEAYYRAKIGTDVAPEAISNPYSTLEDWNYENIGAEVERKGGNYVIIIGNQVVISTDHRPSVISQYYNQNNFQPTYPTERDRSRYYDEKYRDRYPYREEPSYAGRTRNVSIRNGRFIPSSISVRPGDRIIWTNRDKIGHTASSEEYGFDSGIIIPGQAYRLNIKKAGEFNYYCRIHPEMKGVIKSKEVTYTDPN
jgi:plastocyanin